MNIEDGDCLRLDRAMTLIVDAKRVSSVEAAFAYHKRAASSRLLLTLYCQGRFRISLFQSALEVVNDDMSHVNTAELIRLWRKAAPSVLPEVIHRATSQTFPT